MQIPFIQPLQDRIQHWMAQRHPAVTGTIRVKQNRIYVLPSGFGMAYALTCVLVLIGAINYQLSLAYMFAFLMLGLGHAGLIEAFRNLLGLTITANIAPAVFAGETAHFPVQLGDGRNSARHNLRLHAGRSKETLQARLQAGGEAQVWLPVPAPARGWLALPRITIETRYPTGWCRAWTLAHLHAQCLVYPAPEKNPPGWPDGGGNEKTGLRARSGDEDFAGLRQYQPGDTFRQIAWKQSARLEWLAVRMHEAPHSAMLYLRWGDTAGLGLEARLSRLTAWVLQADASGRPYTLELPGRRIEPANGARHREICLRALALFGLPGDAP
ncbi:DUF58 domain-containing protein [Silvimonas iriomotensis]|uniref:DUF58 domain-containing protein n=1 Tax=Silvimonas iriomotensis TaxID=449662 RepID=A0ABQ2P6W5_9NEIS|nr:DUF58 domain-containing protein [Silvimonas iriomotensis]GGP19448.1 hypothetical protein GCM10010970_10660 [Silvimonas iriomotensis]